MTEGPVTRTKRMGARFFKNPPQPHMCIRDYLKESRDACYINVLSWDKIDMATCPSEGLPLYGGMKINPPRTENPQSVVFFVLANPEILRRNGKNAQDRKEQSSLIELLLDFVEAMNEGVVFKRLYKILDDRDITGELKEIWSIVQNDRAKAQDTFGSEDVIKPVPQYPQYQDHTQNQQKHQQQKSHHQQQSQQYRQPSPQQHQHQLQQMQSQHQQPQPPQYHYNYPITNRGSVEKCDNYDLTYIRQNQVVNNSQIDRIYQSRPVANQNNINIGDRMYDYHYQQLPRPMGPSYPTPNCHPTPNLGCRNMANPGIPPVMNHGVNPGAQIHYVLMPAYENDVFVKLHKMQQPLRPQLQRPHAPPVPRYDIIDAFYKAQTNAKLAPVNVFKPQAPSMKNTSNKRQINSSTHVNCSNSPVVKDKLGKSKSPINILQRDSYTMSSNDDKLSHDNICSIMAEKKTVQVTDLDEDEPKGAIINESNVMTISENVKESKEFTSELSCESIISGVTEFSENFFTQSTNVSNVIPCNKSRKNQYKTKKIMLLKRKHSCNDSPKCTVKESETIKNGVKSELECQESYKGIEKLGMRQQLECEQSNISSTRTDNSAYNDEQQVNNDESPDNMTNFTRIVQRINANTSEITTNGSSGQINGQLKDTNKKNDGVYHQVYTILKKPESTSSHEEVTKEIAQLSMKECTDSSEIGVVPS